MRNVAKIIKKVYKNPLQKNGNKLILGHKGKGFKKPIKG